MSQRLAANKRPAGQTLQASLGSTVYVVDSRKLGVPKRKPRNATRSMEANGSSVREWCGEEGNNCLRGTDDQDLDQIMKSNVFFDSYYPRLNCDFSEEYDESKKSQSSTPGFHSNVSSSENLKVGASLKTDSNTPDSSKDIPLFNPMVEPTGSTKCEKIKASDRQSIKSRLTFDSNTYTYTLHSNGSDHESTESRTSGKDNYTIEQNNDSPSDEQQNTSDEKAEAWDNEDEMKTLIKSEGESQDALSAVDCFTDLYKRIETLEDLLQRTLANSVDKKCKCIDGPKHLEKPQPSRTKFSTSRIPESKKQLAVSGSPRACGDQNKADATEEKENADTDNELKSIKKRLRILERKIKQAKTSASVNSVPKTYDLQFENKNSEISDERENEKCCCRMYSLVNAKESDYTRPISETDYFFPSEMLVLTRSELLSDKETSERNLKSEVRRKIASRCKKIKKKCSSIISSRRNKNHPTKINNKCNEIFTDESVGATCLCHSFSGQIKGDNKTPILYVQCPHAREQKINPRKRTRRKRLKKITQLYQKNSQTNFVVSQSEGNQEWVPAKFQNDFNDTSASVECERTSASEMENYKYFNPKKFKRNGRSKPPWVNANVAEPDDWLPRAHCVTFPHDFPPGPHNDCMQWKNSRGKSECKRAKPIKKQSPFRNPLEILKRGGKIKIPVLFEEVCKTLKAKKPSHKVSNVSMRFVLVERDPKHPLKKLIKKLSDGKTPNKMERYVFGVSKCCCETEMNNSKREKCGKRKFA